MNAELQIQIAKSRLVLKGGPGSGNFGHAGRPGEVGGSTPGDDEIPPPDISVMSYVAGGYLEDDGLQDARTALKRSLQLFPEEASKLHSDAQKKLNEIFPGENEIYIYHASASPWRTFRDRDGFDELRSFTYDRSVAERFIQEDLGGSGWLYKVKVPKSWIGIVVNYDDPNIADYAYQKEVLNTKRIPRRAIFEAKQVRGGKK